MPGCFRTIFACLLLRCIAVNSRGDDLSPALRFVSLGSMLGDPDSSGAIELYAPTDNTGSWEAPHSSSSTRRGKIRTKRKMCTLCKMLLSQQKTQDNVAKQLASDLKENIRRGTSEVLKNNIRVGDAGKGIAQTGDPFFGYDDKSPAAIKKNAALAHCLELPDPEKQACLAKANPSRPLTSPPAPRGLRIPPEGGQPWATSPAVPPGTATAPVSLGASDAAPLTPPAPPVTAAGGATEAGSDPLTQAGEGVQAGEGQAGVGSRALPGSTVMQSPGPAGGLLTRNKVGDVCC